ncbi:MAG TPA: phosphoglycerate kinase, partial [Opitutales bacterium]|nr:phosphoglycerate kinase [Opitutales bacterium]
MFPYKTLRDVDVSGKRVFVRVDFNVPLDAAGNVSDDSRIVAALPTIRYLIEHKAKVILASHLGRPDGAANPKYSLLPVALILAKKLNVPIMFAPDCVGPVAEGAVAAMSAGTVVLLENLRFHAGEEANDKQFCSALAKLGDIYVNDAFGTAHRAHASTAGMANLMCVRLAGFLMERELEFLGEKTKTPKKPFVVILGGAKVSDKIKVIESLLKRADTMLIGGAMAYTFLKAQGVDVGASRVELDQLNVARKALKLAKDEKVTFLLPEDHVVTDRLDFDAKKLG